ncbi:hypothetical protein QBC37DRAFT_19461 [Rhypophila decipiens]|uniref:FAD-binding PCMH-type domain-containing protein n=1 Tax=Rhypophila decipiens TaxID=261697 RepID=A0AAN6Y225_9PEZI|nr:hypothetical protein QBC37DRAFT_19461 [Rhypophila decipiens]
MQSFLLKAAAAAALFPTAWAQNLTTNGTTNGTLFTTLLAAGRPTPKLDFRDTAPLVPATYDGQAYGCKCYPGDSCWPTLNKWNALNNSVSGNLIRYIPAAAACHNSFTGPLGTVSNTYDAAACADAQANWLDEDWTVSKPAEYIWSYATNSTCTPADDPNNTRGCTLGYVGVYVVMAKKEAHISNAIDFARKNNIRLIVRNTGHDFLGRSTGYGALILNTHSFQSIEFTNRYTGPGSYRGGAVTIGAGVQGRTILTAAHNQSPPLSVVTGECPTVGVAGGFIQGGGHGPWTTLKGFSVDNVLAFRVMTASGEITEVNESQNADLFWALKGGGPATFAVILSLTMKTFPDLPSVGATLYTNFTNAFDYPTWFKSPSIFHKYANDFVDSGMYIYYEMVPMLFTVRPFVAINQTVAQFNATMAPFLAEMNLEGVPYEYMVKSYPTFYDLYMDLFEAEAAHTNALTGGWAFSHDDFETNTPGIMGGLQTAMDNGGFMIGHLFNSGLHVPSGDNALHPGWRNITDFVISAFLVSDDATIAEKDALNSVVKNVADPAFRAASTSGVTYVNEADPLQDNWQSHFWGSNYPRLLTTRAKWDPKGIFYAVSTPGTEAWEIKDYGTRLCKKL